MVIFGGKLYRIAHYHRNPVVEEVLVTEDNAEGWPLMKLVEQQTGTIEAWYLRRSWVALDPYTDNNPWVLFDTFRYLTTNSDGSILEHHHEESGVQFVCPD